MQLSHETSFDSRNERTISARKIMLYSYRKGLCRLLLQKYARMITLATAAQAHHNEVNAYRLTTITANRMIAFATPKMTMSVILERKVNHRSRLRTPYYWWPD
jgi:hypothetical protein